MPTNHTAAASRCLRCCPHNSLCVSVCAMAAVMPPLGRLWCGRGMHFHWHCSLHCVLYLTRCCLGVWRMLHSNAALHMCSRYGGPHTDVVDALLPAAAAPHTHANCLCYLTIEIVCYCRMPSFTSLLCGVCVWCQSLRGCLYALHSTSSKSVVY